MMIGFSADMIMGSVESCDLRIRRTPNTAWSLALENLHHSPTYTPKIC